MTDKQSNGASHAAKPAASDRAGGGKDARFANYAATQAGGDGIEGDVSKPDKTDDEKLGAKMPDRK